MRQTITEECHGRGYRAVEPGFPEANELPVMRDSCSVNSGGKIFDPMSGHQYGLLAVQRILHASVQGRADIHLTHPGDGIVLRVDRSNQQAYIQHQYQYLACSITRAGIDGAIMTNCGVNRTDNLGHEREEVV